MANSGRNRGFGKKYVQPNVSRAKIYLKAKIITALAKFKPARRAQAPQQHPTPGVFGEPLSHTLPATASPGYESPIPALQPTPGPYSAPRSRTYVITSFVEDSAGQGMHPSARAQSPTSPVVRTPAVSASRPRLRRGLSGDDPSTQPERLGPETTSPPTPRSNQSRPEQHLRVVGEFDGQITRTWSHEAGETPANGSFAERMSRRQIPTHTFGFMVDGFDGLDDPFVEHIEAITDAPDAPHVPTSQRNVPDSWSDDEASTPPAPDPAPAQLHDLPPRTLVPLLSHELPPRAAVQNIQSAMLDLTEALNDLVRDNRTHRHNSRVLASSLAIRETQVEQLRSRLMAAEAEVDMLRDLRRR